MSNNNRSSNRSELPLSTIIDLKGRNVGKEDFEVAANQLRFAEHEGFRGPDLMVANGLALGLEVAIALAAKGDHQAAANQAGNCLYVLKKNRNAAKMSNRKYLGSIQVACRDGITRKIGDMVEWYVSIHARMAEQILAAKEAERLDAEQAEIEMMEAALKLKEQYLSGTPIEAKEVKAA